MGEGFFGDFYTSSYCHLLYIDTVAVLKECHASAAKHYRYREKRERKNKKKKRTIVESDCAF